MDADSAADGAVSDLGFDDIIEAAAGLADLPDLARVHAWASSVLGVWAEAPDPGAIDQEFVEWLCARDDTRAQLVLAAIDQLLPVSPDVLRAAVAALVDPPAWVGAAGTSRATRAWRVHEDDVVSVGLAFELEDASTHSLLADVVDGELAGLVVAPGPDELFDGSEDLIDPEPISVDDAAHTMVEAWEALASSRSLWRPETVFVNGALAARRLGELLGQDLTDLVRPDPVSDDEAAAGPAAGTAGADGALDAAAEAGAIDAAERAELDAWALAVLDGAGVGVGLAGPDILLDALVPARAADYPAIEREAFSALEWADWLGAVIGLVRADVGTLVEPTLLVDLVNRCPEVTSAIPKRDRPYYEWAFSMVLPLWRAGGVIDGAGALSGEGSAMLVGALRRAWAPVLDAELSG